MKKLIKFKVYLYKMNCCTIISNFSGVWSSSDKYYLTSYAAINGHLECLKYAINNGCYWYEKNNLLATNKGHLHILKYSYEIGELNNENDYVNEFDLRCSFSALNNNYLECFKYLYEIGFRISLPDLDYLSNKIDLDDIWWINLLNKKIKKIKKYNNINNLIKKKKLEYETIKQELFSTKLNKDLINYIICPYLRTQLKFDDII